ncbi:MAG: N-acetylneuraminate synthase [Candidatus Riflebacteria bacterium]|nr:N-acetylneuraminate synthase [Candidatus Riflebacteria bacterium]
MAITIGGHKIGDGHPCFIIGEIGINHNGDVELAKKLIDLAMVAGCNAVKFQKRTIEVVYTREELDKPRESPFGDTNRALKLGLEFGRKEYDIIDQYCRQKNFLWFASCWDEQSVDFIEAYNPPCHKIASASLTDDALLRHIRGKGRPILLSTGMSTLEQVDHAVEVLGKDNLVILQSCSVYPADYYELNLRVIPALKERYDVPVGYSGHETGIASSVAAMALGACVIERHITLDRAMWGSDQAASLGPSGLIQLVRDIRLVELGLGDPKKKVMPRELPVMKKLRRVG